MNTEVKKNKGAVLVLALIIASGIAIIAIQVSVFVMSSFTQAKNTDATMVGRYAAESGTENALYQIIKEDWIGATPLRTADDTLGNAVVSFNDNGQLDPEKLSTSSDSISRLLFEMNQSLILDLYEGTPVTAKAPAGVKSIAITWSDYVCDGASVPFTSNDVHNNGLEVSVSEWSENSSNWDADVSSSALISAATGPQGGRQRYAIFTWPPAQAPLILQIKAAQCSFTDLRVSLSKDMSSAVAENEDKMLSGTAHEKKAAAARRETSRVRIPNYFTIRPQGKMQGVTRSVTTMIPARDTHSGLFDFTLFNAGDNYLCKDDCPAQLAP